MAKKQGRDSAPSTLKLKQPTVRKRDVNANYDFSVQQEPAPLSRMGQESFANMPERPMYLAFSNDHTYRDGIINSFSQNVYETSKIHENWSK